MYSPKDVLLSGLSVAIETSREWIDEGCCVSTVRTVHGRVQTIELATGWRRETFSDTSGQKIYASEKHADGAGNYTVYRDGKPILTLPTPSAAPSGDGFLPS